MDVSCTFDKDGSELVLMMTDGVSSEREKMFVHITARMTQSNSKYTHKYTISCYLLR